jgi:hypothetical protein
MKAYFSASYWRHGFSSAKAVAALLSSFGALWLLVEMVSFFAEHLRPSIQALWPYFLGTGVIFALLINKPLTSVACKLSGRDVLLRVIVSDLFKTPGAKIVASNRTFETDFERGPIEKNSIQGQFTTRFYGSASHLDADIAHALHGTDPDLVLEGKKSRYPVGTVAKVATKGKTFYLLALAEINPKGVANASFDDLKTALPALWSFISGAGTYEPLVVPVLGTGYSRLPEPREQVVREIINSFIAACGERRFAESLTIVLYPKDFYKHAIDLQEIGRYLQHVCKYHEYGATLRVGRGTPVG